MKDKKFLIELIIAVVLMVAVAVVGAVIEAKRPVSGEAKQLKMSVTAADGKIKSDDDSTADALVQPGKAIEMVSSLSEEQLGLKNKDKYSFMMNNQAFTIGKDKYIQIIAAIKKENKDGSFSIDPAAKYYVSFDGTKILKENPDVKDEYIEIKK